MSPSYTRSCEACGRQMTAAGWYCPFCGASREMTVAPRDAMAEARRMAQRTIEHWDHLNEEERHGTLHEIVATLAESEAALVATRGDADE